MSKYFKTKFYFLIKDYDNEQVITLRDEVTGLKKLNTQLKKETTESEVRIASTATGHTKDGQKRNEL